MLRCFVYLTALSAALVASSAFAQPGGGGRGGRGGQGGQGGFRMSSAMLLAIPEVQTELGLSDDQKTQIKTAGDDIRKQAQSTFQNMGNMSREERTKAFTDMSKSADEKVGKILTADQVTRLKQLLLQSQGANALVSEEVDTKLKVTDDQKAKIQKVIDDARTAQRGQRGGFNPNATEEERATAAKARSEARAKTLKDAQKVLDDDQLVQWGEMTGKEFKFPDNMGLGRGGFGGQGGQGGGRGGRGGRGGGNGGGGNNGGGGSNSTSN